MAYRALPPATGIVLKRPHEGAIPLYLPCGQCIGCRIRRSQDWATRMVHESKCHEETSFLTLTYTDQHLPDDLCVSVRALQLFFKRLRKDLGDKKVRFFASGEYGEKRFRPHYHIMLFGHAFLEDRKLWRRSIGGLPVYRSARLERLWPFGFSEVGTFSPQSAGYVARYCIKKITGEPAREYYMRVHPLTGELCRVAPEFAVMSRRPGIGADWFQRYRSDFFPKDEAVVNGKKVPVPAYYEKLWQRHVEASDDGSNLVPRDDLFFIKAARKLKARKKIAVSHDTTPERMAVREECLHLRVESLKRDLE